MEDSNKRVVSFCVMFKHPISLTVNMNCENNFLNKLNTFDFKHFEQQDVIKTLTLDVLYYF